MRAFDESLDALHPKDAAKAKASIERLLTYFDGGTRPLGLGLRKLKGSYWEVRVGLDADWISKRLLLSSLLNDTGRKDAFEFPFHLKRAATLRQPFFRKFSH